MKPIAGRTVSGGLIAVSTQICVALFQLVYLGIMARILTPEDFGLYAMAATVTIFVSLFADLGLGMATIQRQTINDSLVSALFYISIAVGIFLFGAITLIAPGAAWLFNDERVTNLIIVAALAVPLTTIGAQHKALLFRELRWPAVYGATLVGQLAGFAFGILAAVAFDWGYWALVVHPVIFALVSSLGFLIFSPWRPAHPIDWSGAHTAILFGLSLSGVSIWNAIARQGDNVLIGWRWGATELGFYSRAYAILYLPITIVTAPIQTIMIPILSRLQSEPERWSSVFLDALAVLTALSTMFAIMMFLLADPIVFFLFGPGWSEAATILKYLSLSTLFAPTFQIANLAFIPLGRGKPMLYWAILAASICPSPLKQCH